MQSDPQGRMASRIQYEESGVIPVCCTDICLKTGHVLYIVNTSYVYFAGHCTRLKSCRWSKMHRKASGDT